MEYLLTIPCTREPEELFAPVFKDEVATYTEKWRRERDVVKIEEHFDYVTAEAEESIVIPAVVKTGCWFKMLARAGQENWIHFGNSKYTL